MKIEIATDQFFCVSRPLCFFCNTGFGRQETKKAESGELRSPTSLHQLIDTDNPLTAKRDKCKMAQWLLTVSTAERQRIITSTTTESPSLFPQQTSLTLHRILIPHPFTQEQHLAQRSCCCE
uniref:Uncharacterized protein n=1 Tax=Steinernema glaseri TaxID=37863 RepID=A0A1I7YFA9_9BILA